ncbi:MAG TPA: NUDIX domain-containing protein [Rubrivivax sp.]|nr:NUDIX domain-containing protein [Burkholderiales bacterium]HNT39087.1 NUDIX domain-containing protein [Rubrivivax sp.]
MSIAHRVRIKKREVRSAQFNRLVNVTLDWQRSDGRWQEQQRETVDHGDAAAILLYDPRRRTVVLLRQLRVPSFENGCDELMIEVPAGLLDGATPAACARAEAEQEVGYRAREPRFVFDAFMSPGTLTERVHGFVAEYGEDDRIAEGGGLEHEGEDIEVFELPFDEAMAMVADGRIRDAKTIMLLQHAALHLFPTPTTPAPTRC